MIKLTKRAKNAIAIIYLAAAVFFVFSIWAGVRETLMPPSNGPALPASTSSTTARQDTSPSSIATSTLRANNGTSTAATTTPPIKPAPSSTKPSSTPSGGNLPPIISANVGHAAGIASGGGLSKISTSTLNQELDQMVALGIKWVRFDIEWGDVQYGSTAPANSTWGNYDRLINALVAHHLYGLGTISYTPQWARTPDCTNGIECPPADPRTFATFAAEVAARYKGDGMHYWEIWNEPNNYSFWAPKTDCVAYTNLLKAVYPAVKKANPNAIIITGGLAPEATDRVNLSEIDFLSCIYANGGKNFFDAIGDHPYSFPTLPSNDALGAWGIMSETNPSLRSIMTANGDGNKKIWFTEFGAPTNGPDQNWYVSEAQQSQMVTDAFRLYKTYDWAGPFFWYTFKDAGTSTDTNENFFGLVRYDGSTKPAYGTMQSLIAAGL